jgi:hypothetical protein
MVTKKCQVRVLSTSQALFSGFCRDVDVICVLGCYAASCGNCLPTFRDYVSVPCFKVQEYVPERKPVTCTVDSKDARGGEQ